MSSTGEDFRKLTPLVLMAALRQARTVVCEPVHHFRLDAPADTLAALMPALNRMHAIPHTQVPGDGSVTLDGDIPAARVHGLRQQLPTLTRGEGVVEVSFDRYDPVTGPVPVRPRTDSNPLNRTEYLQRVTRRAHLAAGGPPRTRGDAQRGSARTGRPGRAPATMPASCTTNAPLTRTCRMPVDGRVLSR